MCQVILTRSDFGYIRWTGKTAEAFVRLNKKPKQLIINTGTAKVNLPGVIEVYVDEKRIMQQEYLFRAGMNQYQLDTSSVTIESGIVKLKIILDKTWNPISESSTDNRELGIAVNRIIFE